MNRNVRIGTVMLAAALMFALASATNAASVLLPDNHSFEADTFTVFPGYVSGNGPITGWSVTQPTLAGINPGGGSPFANNGVIPDGSQVAFVQSNGPSSTLSQTVNGFNVGDRYVLWYRENSRSGYTAPLATTTLDNGGPGIATHAVNPVGGANPYRTQATSVFTAVSNNYTVSFNNTTPTDATLLIDNVRFDHFAATDGTVYNHSFEYDTFYDFPGYSSGANNGPITGWASTDLTKTGLNPSAGSPFADNGVVPDGRNVAFIQSGSSASLTNTVTDLTPGETYQIQMRLNARNGNNPVVNIMSGGDTLLSGQTVTSVGGANPYKLATFYYTATGTTANFSIQNVAGGDNTVLIDNVSYTAVDPKWSVSAWNNDATSGVETGGLYSHAANFGSGANTTINGVLFRGQGGFNPSNSAGQAGGDYTTSGFTGVFNNHGNTLTGGSDVLANDFVYNGNPETITLTGLHAFSRNTLTIYGVGFDNVPGRASTFIDPETGASITVDENTFGNTNGVKITYEYVAKADGTATINIAPLGANTFHVYGMANQVTTTKPIDGLFNTGVDGGGNPLSHNSLDTHWDIISGPIGSTTGDPRVLTSAGGFPIGPWLGDNAESAWIGPNTDDDSNDQPGDYTYRTTFTLDSEVAAILGRFATDNTLVDIFVNGESQGISGGGLDTWTGFYLNSGFVLGLNTLDFVLNNGSPTGPTGLRVEFLSALQAKSIPTPAALPAGLALIGMTLMRRRRMAARRAA